MISITDANQGGYDVIILIDGEPETGKTYFCRELYKVLGRHEHFSFNDSVTMEQVLLIARDRVKIPHPVLVLTGNKNVILSAERILRSRKTVEPIVRLTIRDPALGSM